MSLSLGRPVKRGIRSTPQSRDDAVRATDADALQSRVAALAAGYLAADPYAQYLTNVDEPPKRPVLINIGTALRGNTIDRLVREFIDRAPAVQIVSIGAGSDTRFWRMQHAAIKRYIEVDFPQVAEAKAQRIAHTPLGDFVGTASSSGPVVIDAPVYALIGADLRTVDWHAALFSRLDTTLPTLFLYECVLAYLSPEAGDSLVASLATQVQHAHIVCYDMCIAGDGQTDGSPSRFGHVMLENLGMRRLELPGARAYTTPDAYAARFKKVLKDAGAQSLRQAWLALDPAERTRLSRLEGLDEVEELEMLLGHYCISWAHS
ncbi:[phosphatase 2A protein]-leucine-carboxy methyltransferase [Malassezia cuniculi]|uniref:Leucine carboxyl methyltransferase 1 n=1 Tax=Malassezia cuniculi TaxID=948313 RepID=A0AAF0ESX9_9BASI|nr:[phosphatase 2A protein]-leucine-carboxy methyltransferase [Malassezia cuniculi]